MQVKMKLKVNDEVLVIAGKDKGKIGKILKTIPIENKALVAGINLIKKHQKASNTSAGGIVEMESKIEVSNLALLDPKLKVATRIGTKLDKNGKKIRFAKKSGEIIENN